MTQYRKKQFPKDLIFCDAALAARCELAEAEVLRLYHNILPRLPEQYRPKAENKSERVAFAPICGGTMLFAGPGSPLNHALGMGLTRKVTLRDIERVERFFFARNSFAEIQLAPFAGIEAANMLIARGYKITEYANVLVRPLHLPLPAAKVRVLSIRETRVKDVELATDVVCDGFEMMEFPPKVRQTLLGFQLLPGRLCYMAWDTSKRKSVPVASAAGIVMPKLKLAMLYGSATLPKYRRRGAQLALIRARLAAARKMGCEWATISTFPGTASQRNAERAGFRVAYTKVTWVKDPPKKKVKMNKS